ncbi:hypothetical protein E2C01_101954 [Portunus trituberculatus]|uniref:Uncharacterized protein n=1 Tax=Portunus trituberculatus TaxID=210409 RepID=A0A5B7K6V8_PORTR|nr:hypothetical protein [Portunus trituberculatus]
MSKETVSLTFLQAIQHSRTPHNTVQYTTTQHIRVKAHHRTLDKPTHSTAQLSAAQCSIPQHSTSQQKYNTKDFINSPTHQPTNTAHHLNPFPYTPSRNNTSQRSLAQHIGRYSETLCSLTTRKVSGVSRSISTVNSVEI